VDQWIWLLILRLKSRPSSCFLYCFSPFSCFKSYAFFYQHVGAGARPGVVSLLLLVGKLHQSVQASNMHASAELLVASAMRDASKE
jgi:hypothetical protein